MPRKRKQKVYSIPFDAFEWTKIQIEGDPSKLSDIEREIWGNPDRWCHCPGGAPDVEFFEDFECECIVQKHHFHCVACGGLTTIS